MVRPSPRSPLSRRLMVRLGVVGLVVSLVISAVVIAIDLNLVKVRAIERFNQIGGGYLASIIEDTWLQDRERLAELVLGIRNLPYIEWVEVTDPDGNVLVGSGSRTGGETLTKTFDLTRVYLGQPRDIGRLTVAVSMPLMRRPVLERAWVVLLGNLVVVLGVVVAVALLVHPLVIRPLGRMARYARSVGAADLVDPPAIDMPVDAANDEFLDLAIAFNDMRRAIRESYGALSESESRYRVMFTASPVSLWEEDFSRVVEILDRVAPQADGDMASYLAAHPEVVGECVVVVKVLDVNAATMALHHAPDRAALLGGLDRTFTSASFEAFRRQLVAIWAGETELTLESQVKTLDGVARDVLVHWTVPAGHRERFDRIIVALEDITDRKAAERSLAMTVERMVQANSELERFAYVAAHDLQEPVRSIVSFAQLLDRRLEGTIGDEPREYLQFLVAAAQRMHQQVRGLLEYSQAGATGRGFEPVALDLALDGVRQTMAATITATGAVIDSDPLPRVSGDVSQLAEVFQHLLGNALKFARDGIAPRVRITVTPEAGNWLFSIEDNGIGIDPRYADEIFQVFRRLHGPGRFPGAGVGLAICRRIVERHGGRIWVDTSGREGTTFRFTLPREEAVDAR